MNIYILNITITRYSKRVGNLECSYAEGYSLDIIMIISNALLSTWKLMPNIYSTLSVDIQIPLILMENVSLFILLREISPCGSILPECYS